MRGARDVVDGAFWRFTELTTHDRGFGCHGCGTLMLFLFGALAWCLFRLFD